MEYQGLYRTIIDQAFEHYQFHAYYRGIVISDPWPLLIMLYLLVVDPTGSTDMPL